MFIVDGRTVYKPFFNKKGKEVTIAELETYFGLNRLYKGYHIICTCYEQGSTSYVEGILIGTQWTNFHNNYIGVSYNSNKLTAETTIAGQENNVCWTIHPIEVVSM